MRFFPQTGTIHLAIPLLFSTMPSKASNHMFAQHGPEEVGLWGLAVRKNAAEHSYIQYCIASIAYLYSQSIEPKHQLSKHSQAYEHQITASELFRVSAPAINESNWTAILIFAVSMIVFQFASQQDSERPIDYVETLHVLKRSAGISLSVRPFLEKSPMWSFINRRKLLAVQPIDSDAWIALQCLDDGITLSESQDRETLLRAVRMLKEWTTMCNASPQQWKDYVIFPGMVPNDYLELLAMEDDFALLILVYWCAIMRLGPDRWFLQQWLPRTAALAETRMTGDWSDYLEWASRVLSS